MLHFSKSKSKRRLGWKFAALGAGVFFVISAYYFYEISVPLGSSTELKKFVVEPGWGSTKISYELNSAALVESPLAFQFYTWSHGISSRLLDGAYQLSPNMTIPEIARILNRGTGTSNEVILTFIEGWSNRDIAQYISGKGIASADDFFAVIQKKASWWDAYSILESKPKNLDLEGYLFPDTYRVYRSATVTDVVKKMLDNMETKLTPKLRDEIKKQNKTIHEILTVASILEKEVSTDNDREMVADILYKRLAAGIPLQLDSTVNYATGKSQTRSSATDLTIDSPYNTYRYKGLPPGPIGNPGMSAILAALYPQKNPYYYFLTTPSGQVIYSSTNDEHIKAKALYYK